MSQTTSTPDATSYTRTLADRHLRELRDESAIPLELIAEEGYRTVTDAHELAALGFADYQCRPGLLIPLHGAGGSNGRYALKPDHPRTRDGKPVKYEYPQGQPPILDVPVRCLEQLADATVPILFTEGAKKSDCAAGLDFCAVNIWGVHAWYRNPQHHGFASIQPLPDWDAIAPTLDGRICYLCFDSDAWSKESVALALRRLANWLGRQGAIVYIIHLPDADDGSKQGLDDVVARAGADTFLEHVQDAEAWGSRGMVRYLQARVRELEDERSAVFELLSTPNMSATQRIVGAKAICSTQSRLSRGEPAPMRVLIDAPKNPESPEDGERIGLASDCGLGRNTVARALDVVCGDGAPIGKQTIVEHNEQGELRTHIELVPRCAGGVPGMLRALAKYKPDQPKQHGGSRPRCPDHPDAELLVRTVCTLCGQVVHETTVAPTHQVGAPVQSKPPIPSYVVSAHQSGASVRSHQIGASKTSPDVGASLLGAEKIVVIPAAEPPASCPNCRGVNWWTRGLERICRRCHPPPPPVGSRQRSKNP